MSLLVSQPGKGSILSRLKTVFSRTKDLSPLIEPVRKVLWEANRDRALKGVDAQGKPYAPLSKRTLEDRRRLGYPPGPPLNRQGLKARIITGCVVNVTQRDGELRVIKGWPNVAFMIFHILGTRRMPRRDPLGWGMAEMEEVRAMLPKHVFTRTFGR